MKIVIDGIIFVHCNISGCNWLYVSLKGKFYHKNTNQVFEPTYFSDGYNGLNIKCNDLSHSLKIQTKYLVARAWYIYPEFEWYGSEFYEYIKRFQKFYMRMAAGDLAYTGVENIKYRLKYYVSRYGEVFTDVRCQELASYPNDDGYRCIKMTNNKEYKVHRLVAIHFCPKPEHLKDIPFKDLQVNHIDSDPANNIWTNLEWCTGAENVDHCWKAHTRIDGKELFSEEDLNLIGKSFSEGKSDSQIARLVNRSVNAIFCVRTKSRPKYIKLWEKYKWKHRSYYLKKLLRNIKLDLKKGLTKSQIAKKYDTSTMYVSILAKYDTIEEYYKDRYNKELKDI